MLNFVYAIGCNYNYFTSSIEPDVTDHIPVEDNPIYIKMKKIDLKKNSAYETIIVSRR